MRKLALVCTLLLATAAVAQSAMRLVTGRRYEFTDCGSGGSAAQTVSGAGSGKYLMRVTDADVFICIADSGSTCVSGGEKFPVGTIISIAFGGDSKSVSCRSAGTGDLILTAWE